MLIYYILLIVCLLLATISNKKQRKICYYGLVFVLIFVGSFRGLNVGDDLHGSYFFKYQYLTMNPLTWDFGSEMEPGFCFYLAFIKTQLLGSYRLFYGLTFAITMVCIHFLIIRYSKDPIISLFFLILLIHYAWAFNAIRQAMAIGLVFLFLPLLEKGSLWRVLLFEIFVLIITFSWHRTCICYTILPLLVLDKFKMFMSRNRLLICVVLLASYLVVLVPSFVHGFSDFLISRLSFLGSRYVMYIDNAVDTEHTKSALTALLQTAVTIYITAIIPRKYLSNPFFIFYIVGMVVSNVLGAYNALFLRVGVNFLYFDIILFANLWHCKGLRNLTEYKIIIVLYGLITFSNTLFKNFGKFVPYTNWLLDI